MVKLYGLQFTQNLLYGVNKGPRQTYKIGQCVLVTELDKVPLMRYGCKLIGEKDVQFSDIFKDEKKKATPEVTEETEAPKKAKK